MPNIDDEDETDETHELMVCGISEPENYNHIYRHIKNFEKTINHIVNQSKQNMRKHCAYLE